MVKKKVIIRLYLVATVLFCTQYVWKCLVFATKYFLSFFQRKLQRVSAEVPLDGVLKGVGTLEELLALLLSEGPLAGVPVLIGQVHHLQILGELEARLQVPGDISEVFLLLQNLADQSLLALDIIVVKLLVVLLQHGDPLEHVHGVESPSLVAGPGLALVSLVVLVVVLPVSAVARGGGGEQAAGIDEVEDDAEQDDGAQEGEGGGGGAGVEVEEPSFSFLHHGGIFILCSHCYAQEEG